jgi:hypothetical protein
MWEGGDVDVRRSFGVVETQYAVLTMEPNAT